MKRELRVVGIDSESDLGGPEEAGNGYGGGFPGGRRGNSRDIGYDKDRIPGHRITGWM